MEIVIKHHSLGGKQEKFYFLLEARSLGITPDKPR